MIGSNSRSEILDIAIIGAGIGGTATAIALTEAGFAVDLFEQGGGIARGGRRSRAARTQHDVARPLGRARHAAAEDGRGERGEVRDDQGSILGSTSTAVDEDEPKSAFSVHRADLQHALVSKLQGARLHLDHRMASIGTDAEHAEATFENGRRIRARLIVGADGLRSVARTLLDSTPMSFLRLVTHRTIAPASLLPADMPNDRLRTWLVGKLTFLLLPIRAGAEVSISAGIPAAKPPETLWSETSADGLLSAFADADPLIARLIEGRTTDVTTHPIYDKDPIGTWTDRRLVLLGDAAHPMSPMNGQGANQAIQDAGTLAASLNGRFDDDLPSALADYQSARAPVTARIQTQSRTPAPALARLMAAAR